MSIYPNDPDRQRMVHIVWISAVVAVACMVLIFGWTGCTQQQGKEPVSTGRVILAKDLPGVKADTEYGEINSSWLKPFYGRWKADLFSKGIVKWDGRFDCNRFASHYQAAAQIEYFIDNFHSYTPGKAAAIAEVWYFPGGYRVATPSTGPPPAHAIVAAYTERGPIFIEPQTGRELALTPAEKASIYYTRF